MASPPRVHFLGTEMMLIERNSLIRRWSLGRRIMPLAICNITYALSFVFSSTIEICPLIVNRNISPTT